MGDCVLQWGGMSPRSIVYARRALQIMDFTSSSSSSHARVPFTGSRSAAARRAGGSLLYAARPGLGSGIQAWVGGTRGERLSARLVVRGRERAVSIRAASTSCRNRIWTCASCRYTESFEANRVNPVRFCGRGMTFPNSDGISTGEQAGRCAQTDCARLRRFTDRGAAYLCDDLVTQTQLIAGLKAVTAFVHLDPALPHDPTAHRELPRAQRVTVSFPRGGVAIYSRLKHDLWEMSEAVSLSGCGIVVLNARATDSCSTTRTPTQIGDSAIHRAGGCDRARASVRGGFVSGPFAKITIAGGRVHGKSRLVEVGGLRGSIVGGFAGAGEGEGGALREWEDGVRGAVVSPLSSVVGR